MKDFELFSQYFFYDETLDLVFNRVTRRRAAAFQVSGFEDDFGQRKIKFRGQAYQGWRIAHLLQHGKWPRNKSKLYRSNKTGHKNISWQETREKYLLLLNDIHGKLTFCSYYSTLKEAREGKKRFLQMPEFKREEEV